MSAFYQYPQIFVSSFSVFLCHLFIIPAPDRKHDLLCGSIPAASDGSQLLRFQDNDNDFPDPAPVYPFSPVSSVV